MSRVGLVQSAAAASANGRFDEAIAFAREALSDNPVDPVAWLALGIAGVKKGDAAVSIPALRKALEYDPGSADAPFWLSMAYRKQGCHAEALAMAERAVARNGASEHSQNQLGMCLLDLGRAAEAAACFRRAIELAPGVGPLFENLGRALRAQGLTSEAIAAFHQAVSLGPMHPGVLFQLGDAYMSLPSPGPAVECARAILSRDPNSVQGTMLMARALIADGRVAEGADCAKRAAELSPDSAVPPAYYGRALQSLGRIEEADAQFRRSIELDPRQGFAYYSLTHNRRVREEDRPLIAQMEALAAEGTLPLREMIQLEYGLGKGYEDLAEFGAAMGRYDSANRLDHALKMNGSVGPFQTDKLREAVDYLIRLSEKPAPASRGGSEGDTPASQKVRPIFVIGMMRSGTTLAEQILSSHSEVGGAGEVRFWPEQAGTGPDIPSRYEVLAEADLAELAHRYLALLARAAPVKPYVVDKMNTNYLHVGLLRHVFPEARFVHMKRHPVDTCISIWATPVAVNVDLCASKENVVFAYREYLRLMAHWRKVIPPNRLLDVQYEDLVGDREAVTGRIIEFCGLSWDAACMSPELNERSVKTPSVWQVRQPVYSTSVARWRRFEPWLGAFAELLDAG